MTNLDRIRFIHTSDWQLGITRVFLGEEAGARYSQARVDAIAELGRLAQEHDAGFIVVAGDVFESNQISRRTLTRALAAMASLPVPLYLLPGNHDPLDGASIFATPEVADAGDGLFVLRGPEPLAVAGIDGVEVVGAPWRNKHPGTDLCAEMAAALAPADGVLRVAVAHGQVDALSPDASRPGTIAQDAVEDALARGRFHYLALGDRHSLTPVGESGRVWYSGTPVATAFDEKAPNQALLVELTADECEVTPLVVGNWTFVARQQTMNGADDLAAFEQWLAGLPDKECCAVKVGFEGSLSLADAARLDGLMEANEALFASLRRRERTMDLAVVPDDLDREGVSLSGYARATWDELLALASRGDDSARDALRLLYRLGIAGGG